MGMLHPTVRGGCVSDSLRKEIRDYERHPSKMFDRQQQKRLWVARDIPLMLADHSGANKFRRRCCVRKAFISNPSTRDAPLKEEFQPELNLPRGRRGCSHHSGSRRLRRRRGWCLRVWPCAIHDSVGSREIRTIQHVEELRTKLGA